MNESGRRYYKSVARLVQLMWIPVLLTALYIGWVFFERHRTQAAPTSIEQDPLAKYGDAVKIVQFYSTFSSIRPGGSTLICYGVVNAKEVRLDPPVEKVWPAIIRCFDASPLQTTRYTLTAEGANHKLASESLVIAVVR